MSTIYKEERVSRVGFVVSKKEREALRIIAHNEGVKEAVLLRRLLRYEAKRHGIIIEELEIEEVAK